MEAGVRQAAAARNGGAMEQGVARRIGLDLTAEDLSQTEGSG
jgi:hypothetical protein